ncbi:hypothetical protein PSPO01_01894 [Paraphaeosphaeria sporulosa]
MPDSSCFGRRIQLRVRKEFKDETATLKNHPFYITPRFGEAELFVEPGRCVKVSRRRALAGGFLSFQVLGLRGLKGPTETQQCRSGQQRQRELGVEERAVRHRPTTDISHFAPQTRAHSVPVPVERRHVRSTLEQTASQAWGSLILISLLSPGRRHPPRARRHSAPVAHSTPRQTVLHRDRPHTRNSAGFTRPPRALLLGALLWSLRTDPLGLGNCAHQAQLDGPAMLPNSARDAAS